jgi:hypothetical protein
VEIFLTEEAMERVKREWNVGIMKRRREGREEKRGIERGG